MTCIYTIGFLQHSLTVCWKQKTKLHRHHGRISATRGQVFKIVILRHVSLEIKNSVIIWSWGPKGTWSFVVHKSVLLNRWMDGNSFVHCRPSCQKPWDRECIRDCVGKLRLFKLIWDLGAKRDLDYARRAERGHLPQLFCGLRTFTWLSITLSGIFILKETQKSSFFLSELHLKPSDYRNLLWGSFHPFWGPISSPERLQPTYGAAAGTLTRLHGLEEDRGLWLQRSNLRHSRPSSRDACDTPPEGLLFLTSLSIHSCLFLLFVFPSPLFFCLLRARARVHQAVKDPAAS